MAETTQGLIAALERMADRYDMTATERYEVDSELFYVATGYMAPGKDVPMAMGGQNEKERRDAHVAWVAERNAQQQADIRAAIAALRAAPAPEGETPLRDACKQAMEACRTNLARYAYKDEPALLAAFKACEAALGLAAAPTELPDEFEADGVNYCGHCYQAIEQTPSEHLAAALASDSPNVSMDVLNGVTVAGARAFWALKDLEAKHEALRADVMTAVSDPHLTWEQARAKLSAALNGPAAPAPIPKADAPENCDLPSCDFPHCRSYGICTRRAAPAPEGETPKALVEDLVVALRALAYAAMTSGGTKGPDAALKDAIRWATDALQKYDKLRAAPAPEGETPSHEDREQALRECVKSIQLRRMVEFGAPAFQADADKCMANARRLLKLHAPASPAPTPEGRETAAADRLLIEQARQAVYQLRDAVRLGQIIGFRQRDPLVLTICRALDLAALTGGTEDTTP
jgi:hypothetical protein